MTVSFNENYFQLFEIEKSLFIDLNVLEEKYLELQKEFHPDKYVNASEQEKRLSIQITSYINEAYNTLKNDYLKSIYLLKIEGYKLEDQNNTISDSVATDLLKYHHFDSSPSAYRYLAILAGVDLAGRY